MADEHSKKDEHHEEREHHHKEEFNISVNGTPEVWGHDKITYQQVVKLAFPDGPTGDDIRYNVSWTKPDGEEGFLRIDGPVEVDVVNNMSFDVRNTHRS